MYCCQLHRPTSGVRSVATHRAHGFTVDGQWSVNTHVHRSPWLVGATSLMRYATMAAFRASKMTLVMLAFFRIS